MTNSSWKKDAPRTEALWENFDDGELNDIKTGDRKELEQKGGELGLEVSPFALRGRLRSYEVLTRNAAEEWFSIGYYLIDEYVNDLSSRDGLARVCNRLPPRLGARVTALVEDLDEALWEATEPDRERVVLDWTTPEGGEWAAGWWWYRLPKVVPWLR